jgi:hypothetical protein
MTIRLIYLYTVFYVSSVCSNPDSSPTPIHSGQLAGSQSLGIQTSAAMTIHRVLLFNRPRALLPYFQPFGNLNSTEGTCLIMIVYQQKD